LDYTFRVKVNLAFDEKKDFFENENHPNFIIKKLGLYFRVRVNLAFDEKKISSKMKTTQNL